MAAMQFYTQLFYITMTIITASAMKEVCQWETFEAKCQQDEVIMITKAEYGRMGVGRCQPRDFGFAGCSADVSAIMHSRCSGKSYCSVPIPDPVMFAATPCPKDLVTYLQADYKCIKVAKHANENCDDQILTAATGDIAKPLTTTNNYVCPQRILAQPGQTVNVYLYDFYSKDINSETTSDCITYGFVSEGSSRPIKICGGEFRKNHLIYSSNKNVVDITLLTEEVAHSHHYILHYEIVGCPTLHAPPNAWVKIEGDMAVVMCNFSHIASELVCAGNDWVGNMQNCTSFDADLLRADSPSVTAFDNSVTSVTIVLCAGVASGVLFIFGLLALIKAHRSRGKTISDLPQIQPSLFEKPALHQNEKCFKPVDQYQPLYMPITMDSRGHYTPMHQHNVLDTQLPMPLSQIPHISATDYASTLNTHLPSTQNIYGRLGVIRPVSISNTQHPIFDINRTGQPRDLIITMQGTSLK